MQESDWHNGETKCFAMLLAETNPDAPPPLHGDELNDSSGLIFHDDALLIIFNAHQHSINYQLPDLSGGWQTLIDTALQTNSNNMTETGDSQLPPSEKKTHATQQAITPAVTRPLIQTFTHETLSNNKITIAAYSCMVLSYSHISSAVKKLL